MTDYISAGPYLASGDVNNDGETNVVLTNGGRFTSFSATEMASTTGSSYDSISGLYSAGYLTISDLDGDGNADIHVGIANGSLYLGDSYSFNQACARMGNPTASRFEQWHSKREDETLGSLHTA